MPNYNHAPYLRERLDSILAQDYPNFEVILLDDASIDNSVTILSEYAKHPRVKAYILNDANSGNTFLQWQRGLQQATGDYVWIAESDDVACPNLLTKLVTAIEINKSVLAFCASNRIDEEGRIIPHRTDRTWKRGFCVEGKDFVRNFLLGYCYICNASAVVFRREAAMNVDFSMVQKYPASGDRCFWIQMAMQGNVAYVPEPLNGFRQHTQKVSGNAENRGINMQQDHEIYNLVKGHLELSKRQRQLICGYHWQAIHRSSVSPEGRKKAIGVWASEKEFCKWSYDLYMIHRLIEKVIPL